MKKEDLLIIGSGLVILVVIIIASFLLPDKPKEEQSLEEIKIVTDTESYNKGDSLKIKIENNLNRSVCFSSCYPYYFEKKNGDWVDYDYMNCPNGDLPKDCIDSKNTKAFELTIPDIEGGVHRLALSACLGCNFEDSFKEDQKFYSNTFIIK
jgi:hypothetical protein